MLQQVGFLCSSRSHLWISWTRSRRFYASSPCCVAYAKQQHQQHVDPLELLNPSQAQLVEVYIDSLLHWNEKMNLTSVTNREEIMARHVSDSLALLPVMDDALSTYCSFNVDTLKVVDVGSGGGLPGIILGIARPHWQVTLMESIQKKCYFLEDAVQTLGLHNVEVVRARAEDKGQEASFREAYNIAVARAVAEMRVLVELCLPLVCTGGFMVAAKGADPQDEIRRSEKAVRTLGGVLLPIRTVASESPYGKRTAVVALKQTSTPLMYPRKPGTPGKAPL